ncbi:hypothetical protein [Bilophila sp.]|uniref:hypothetical protein n=1 Tax=Bilophila sp. TaxID=1929485 RepID=UPI0030779018
MNIHQWIRTLSCLTVAISFIFMAYFDYQKVKIGRQQIVASTISIPDGNLITSTYRLIAQVSINAGFSLKEICEYLYEVQNVNELIKNMSNNIK